MADTAAPEIGTPLKPIHSLVLDTGPLVKNDPPADVLRARSEKLYILPSVIAEIRDAATRSRVETTLMPFVEVRTPKPDSLAFVKGFARKTGDLGVLSRQDIEVLALGYELECERNGGDWRLRSVPGQKSLNGKPPGREDPATDNSQEPGAEEQDKTKPEAAALVESTETEQAQEQPVDKVEDDMLRLNLQPEDQQAADPESTATTEPTEEVAETAPVDEIATTIPAEEAAAQPHNPILLDGEKADENIASAEAAEETDSDEDGWITPSNLKQHQAKDTSSEPPSQPVQKTLQAAVLTSDFAMQNVALRMNLNLVSPSFARITHVKTWVLRCHGCFQVTRDMTRQFCPSCGQPTLMRTSCSTDDRGNFTLHLKRNFQWNKRGNVYSVPKPVHGSSNGRLPPRGSAMGGQNGWGRDLIFAEDQKEYTRAAEEQRRAGKKRDNMDEDYLPGLLTGDRSKGGSKIKVGAGRSVNSRRKH